jgi:hypothetical protein
MSLQRVSPRVSIPRARRALPLPSARASRPFVIRLQRARHVLVDRSQSRDLSLHPFHRLDRVPRRRARVRAAVPRFRAYRPSPSPLVNRPLAPSRRVASRRVASSDGRVARESHASSDGRVASRRARTERAQLPELALYRALRPSRILAQILPRPRRRRRRHPRVASWRPRAARARSIDRETIARSTARRSRDRSIDRAIDRRGRRTPSIAPLDGAFSRKSDRDGDDPTRRSRVTEARRDRDALGARLRASVRSFIARALRRERRIRSIATNDDGVESSIDRAIGLIAFSRLAI